MPSSTNSQHLAQQHQLFQQSLADMKQQNQQHHSTTSLSPTSASASINLLYQGLPEAQSNNKVNSSSDFDVTPIAMGSKLGLLLLNPAPDLAPEIPPISHTAGTKLNVGKSKGKNTLKYYFLQYLSVYIYF